MPDIPEILILDDVHKSYTGSDGVKRREILTGINLRINAGQSIAILGPSGSGKSTLLNLIGALDKADSGRITLDGQCLGEANEKELTHFRSNKIGFIFQQHHLLPQCTVWENILIPTIPAGLNKDPVTLERARRLLNRVALDDHRQKRPGQLSGGECQRVAVVRALVNRPLLLLADEPTGALDEDTATSIGDLLIELNKEESVTLITVTHSVELAHRMSRTYKLHNGTLEAGQ
ncbi:ABC transporter ATP-binding protein [bacterium]|nr:ABC transporter ATP-binding protein [bacterium]